MEVVVIIVTIYLTYYIRVRALDFKNKLLADQVVSVNEGAYVYKVKGNRLIKQLEEK